MTQAMDRSLTDFFGFPIGLLVSRVCRFSRESVSVMVVIPTTSLRAFRETNTKEIYFKELKLNLYIQLSSPLSSDQRYYAGVLSSSCSNSIERVHLISLFLCYTSPTSCFLLQELMDQLHICLCEISTVTFSAPVSVPVQHAPRSQRRGRPYSRGMPRAAPGAIRGSSHLYTSTYGVREQKPFLPPPYPGDSYARLTNTFPTNNVIDNMWNPSWSQTYNHLAPSANQAATYPTGFNPRPTICQTPYYSPVCNPVPAQFDKASVIKFPSNSTLDHTYNSKSENVLTSAQTFTPRNDNISGQDQTFTSTSNNVSNQTQCFNTTSDNVSSQTQCFTPTSDNISIPTHVYTSRNNNVSTLAQSYNPRNENITSSALYPPRSQSVIKFMNNNSFFPLRNNSDSTSVQNQVYQQQSNITNETLFYPFGTITSSQAMPPGYLKTSPSSAEVTPTTATETKPAIAVFDPMIHCIDITDDIESIVSTSSTEVTSTSHQLANNKLQFLPLDSYDPDLYIDEEVVVKIEKETT